ncbi:hypothetical protein Tery_3307 [Trichodesmium erythraeum IMS101]|uniref:Hemolysin-type calcium-binding region n=1 Tax=Trichodesmium erythraeum (strain IMS101) TaxID=203124 RepID=Q10ZB1_TRIEI
MSTKINSLKENFSFELLDYEIEHQGQAVIDIAVDMDYKEGIGQENPFEYPDFIPIAEFIDNFLVTYPNETDFWEILNKNLIRTLLTQPIPTPYGVEYNLDEILDSLTVDIQVQSGSSDFSIPRASQVVGIPETEVEVNLGENFSFELLDYEIEHQGQAVIDIAVDMDYKEGIGQENPFEYPDFVPIAEFIDNFLVTYPNETDFWEILNKNLIRTLLTQPIPTPYGVEYNLDEILDSLTVDIQVQSGSSDFSIPRASQVVGIPETEVEVNLGENFSFELLDYEIEHQGQAVIDIAVDMDYKEGIGQENPFEYPDFVPIAEFIDNFLVTYPNETDFWEILNKNLIRTLLTQPIPTPYGVEYNLDEILDSLTVDIQVQSGSSDFSIPRASQVVGIPETEVEVNLGENFSFELLDYEIEHQGQAVIDIAVDMDYKEGIGQENPFEYPDFIPIAQFIDNFLVTYPNETDFWEILNKNLIRTLLTQPIPTPYGVEYNLDEILDSLTVDIQVQSGSSDFSIPRASQVVQTVDQIEDTELLQVVFGTAGDDIFDSAFPEDTQFEGAKQILFTGNGNDKVDVSQIGINNWIDTGSGNDIVFTGTSNRIILGNDNDIIFAGTGQGGNYISLGEGKDQLWVSTNNNDLPENLNQINDFNPEDDVIGFANTILSLDNKGELWDYQQLGNDIIISAFGQEIAQLFNTTITESNFVFFGHQQNL